ncbi:MAG: S41 family peptidase [Candidatus Gracilibacteria bacterium]
MKNPHTFIKVLICSLTCLFALFTGAKSSFASYKDVPDDSQYIQGITFLELIGAVDNSDYFRPEDPITRAEFFKILFKVFKEETLTTTKNYFTDVPTDAWFAPFAELAGQNNLIEGDLFEPNKTLKRIDSLKFLLESYGQTGGIVTWSERMDLFKDVPKIHPYYSTIARAISNGILTSDPEQKWRPFAEITRAELAGLVFDFDTWNTNRLIEEQAIANSTFYKSDIFASIWAKITNDFYIPEGSQIDPDALFESAVKGMLESLNDPYTSYFVASQATEFTDSLSGQFEGIGAVLAQDEITGQIFITEFINDSPAEKSGLKIGDEITAVDDVTIAGMPIDQVISRIKGPKDTVVHLTIARNGESLTFKITRAVIGIELLTGQIIEDDVWLIDIDVFASNTGATLVQEITELQGQVKEPSAIVIDVRGNGGGYIMASNAVAGVFVPQLTPLVHLDYGGGYVETIYNGDFGTFAGIPLYIFVDEYTASASEILAQTLKEEDEAIIIGTQTFGKGTAQSLTQYWDGSALKLTIAHWLSADYTSINSIGITPDVLITKDETLADEEIDALYTKALQKLLD